MLRDTLAGRVNEAATAVPRMFFQLRTGRLSWLIGVFCTLFGALMLVAPHEFSQPVYSWLQPRLAWEGAALFATGGALLWVATTGQRRTVRLPAHLCAFTAMAVMAVPYAVAGAWPGAVLWSVFASATAIAGLLKED